MDGHAKAAYQIPSFPWLAGTLSCLDGFMNIALEETQEVVEGVQRGKYGDTFIRGNNGEAEQSG